MFSEVFGRGPGAVTREIQALGDAVSISITFGDGARGPCTFIDRAALPTAAEAGARAEAGEVGPLGKIPLPGGARFELCGTRFRGRGALTITRVECDSVRRRPTELRAEALSAFLRAVSAVMGGVS